MFVRKLNKKGKPTGKPVLVGFTFEFSSPLGPSAAGNAANYQVDTVTTKRVKKKNQIILRPLSGFSVSYTAASDSVRLTLAGKPAFATGGQITVLAGVTGASGGELEGTTVFKIVARGPPSHRLDWRFWAG